jgi:hypothetical protein
LRLPHRLLGRLAVRNKQLSCQLPHQYICADMYILTLNPGESAFVRCTRCENLNLMVTNEKDSDVSLQFNTKDDQLDAQCFQCKSHYFWTPASVAIVKPAQNSN